MKIGLITGEYPPMQGGVGDFSLELSQALVELGHEVHVITRVTCGADPGQKTEDKNVTVHAVMLDWGWRSYRQVMGLASRMRLDVLNIQYQSAAYDLHPAINFFPWRAGFLFIGRKRRPPIVITFHDLKYPYLFPKAGPLRNWVVTLLARHADAVIVTNQADELSLANRRIRRIARIPIGSNIAPTLPNGYDRETWRAQLGLTPHDFLLGFFGFFNERKGVENLTQALAILHQADLPNPQIPSPHLLFIGGTVGSSDATNRVYAEHITTLIAKQDLSNHVHYTGFVSEEEVSTAFAATDLCVLPYADGVSFHHGTLIAALAHGCPIVSTLPPIEIPELIHGENVWLVPPENPNALAGAIATLAVNSEARKHLSKGSAKLSAEFTWQSIASRTIELFERVTSKT